MAQWIFLKIHYHFENWNELETEVCFRKAPPDEGKSQSTKNFQIATTSDRCKIWKICSIENLCDWSGTVITRDCQWFHEPEPFSCFFSHRILKCRENTVLPIVRFFSLQTQCLKIFDLFCNTIWKLFFKCWILNYVLDVQLLCELEQKTRNILGKTPICRNNHVIIFTNFREKYFFATISVLKFENAK